MIRKFGDFETELKQISIDSPIPELKIGDIFNYKGRYKDGYDEGFSKIKGFYIEEFYINGEKSNSNRNSCFMELENGKLILLGFMVDGSFEVRDNYNS